ncbi:hypothetical protein PInf_022444 [Phytophthora infestans]|nr:hypothetical protein PInf_022444 [Phytophthora infestans]
MSGVTDDDARLQARSCSMISPIVSVPNKPHEGENLPMPGRAKNPISGPTRGDDTPPSRPVAASAVTPSKTKKLKKTSNSRPTNTKKSKKNNAEIEELLAEMTRLKKQTEKYKNRAEILQEREDLCVRDKHAGPFDTLTHLPKDPNMRHIALLRMKHERLQRAYEFMRERQRFMDVTKEFCDQKKFQATNGDLCSERFEVVPLPEAQSVKAIVDALEYFVYNIEISMSEVLGDITIRENDDPRQSSSVAQHRLVTTVEDVLQMDTNNVAFNEYIPPGPGQDEVGFSISDAVDEDDAFPYKPTRWWCLRLRRSTIDVPPNAVTRIQNGIEHIGAAMIEAARHADAQGNLQTAPPHMSNAESPTSCSSTEARSAPPLLLPSVAKTKRRQTQVTRKDEGQSKKAALRARTYYRRKSFISEFLRAHDHSKYEPVIRLGKDPRERLETLLAMKQQRLQEAVYFLSERSRQMRMDTEFTDLQRFTSGNGDVCLVRFDIKPLHSARSVMQAFEGVLKFAYNLEISISDLLGHLTNNVTFMQYWEDGTGPNPDRAVGKELGVAVCNYVEDDALYPYLESDRVRQDITYFVVIAKYPRNLPGAFSDTDVATSSVSFSSSNASESGATVRECSKNQDEMVEALRWTCLRLRTPWTMKLPPTSETAWSESTKPCSQRFATLSMERYRRELPKQHCEL